MKTAIIYESKKGFTKKVANLIHENLSDSVISNTSTFDKSIEYEHYVLLSPLYYGQLNKKIKEFIELNLGVLLRNKVTIIFSGMNVKEFDNIFEMNLSKDLLAHAEIIHAGGAYNFKKLNFLEKFIVKKVAGVKESFEEFKEDSIREFMEMNK